LGEKSGSRNEPLVQCNSVALIGKTMTLASQRLSLEAFLELPETKPASEYISGRVIQKPMPKARHSRLQAKISNGINELTEAAKIAYAFPELRCTMGGRSIVPDIAVLFWDHIEFDETGEPVDDVKRAPDWTIEILPPDQSSNRVAANILHCIEHGCQLGWLVDPSDRSILVYLPKQQPKFCEGSDALPIPEGIPIELTADQVFGWLKMKA
jgi:Uma2 family endonuclease